MQVNEWKEEAFAKTFEGYQRVAEFNSNECYEGWGAGIATRDGKFYVAEYSHCSCNDAFEGMGTPSEYDCLVDALRGVTSYYRDDLFKALQKEVA